MSARDRILARVSGAIEHRLGDAAATAETRRAVARARLASGEQPAPVPSIAQQQARERIDQFVEQAEDALATVTRLTSIDAVPEALAEALRARNLPAAVRMGSEPDFVTLDWGALDVTRGPGRVAEPVTLSRAFAGYAETGTLALLSGDANPVTLTFLGETHFVVLRASEIDAGLEGLWARLRKAGVDPRTVNLVTGPSRTADIEQTLELGAHGPIALHIFLVDDV